MKKKYYFFIGTTAEFIKLAPVIAEFKKRRIKFKVITSGQTKVHFKMMNELAGPVRADFAFKEKNPKPSVLYFVLWAIRTLLVGLYSLRGEFKNMNKKNCDFIVHGDTVSSLIGALLAKRFRLNLIHIESGLRSYNFLEPFPEEISRYLISQISDVHLCPNVWSMQNLNNVRGAKINTKQNTLIESFNWAINKKDRTKKISLPKGKYFVLVVHRQEHVIFGKSQTKLILENLFDNTDRKIKCLFLVHDISYGFVQNIATQFSRGDYNITLIPRLSYPDFMKLIQGSQYWVTDGGSNQEEAYYMGKPCLLLRNRSERIEGLGENVVLSENKKNVMKKFTKNYKRYKRKRVLDNKYPSKIIVDNLTKN